ncbi:hypothetical protein ABL78_7872 [Leptomonas seymouri]|uniref:Uncharacterized protein n=1 Tax=Leptomonas seymouri TaxID=5684 RepID=A0A0N1P9K9_LEPSE|nr:hypothetical protein ABL78_7872 [Leptomonas seymouri]|eukprot:KPI83104.1 hypothetical protein ABL78_7872 [Leptomonas seymouri]
MRSRETGSVATSSEMCGADNPYGATTGTSSSSRNSSRRSALAKNPSASTPSSHTLPRPNELSMRAPGQASPPSEALLPTTGAYSSMRHEQAATTTTGDGGDDRVTPSSLPHHAFPKVSMPTPAATARDASHDVRDTVEYRAAWDLELWKAVQADRFRKQLARQKSAAFADLERSVKRREKEALAELAQRAQGVALREEAAKSVEAQLTARQGKLSEMEKDLRRMRQQLLDAQQRVEDEVRAQVRLANDTIAHRARLLEERVKAAEAQVKRADERQRQAQEDYLGLYEAFNRYRSQQLASAASDTNGFLNVSSTSAALSPALTPALQLEQLRAQWDAEHQLRLDRQEQLHKSEMAIVQERCRELEERNRRLTAALARRREQLRNMRGAGADTTLMASASPVPQLCVDSRKQTVAVPTSAVSVAAAATLSPPPPVMDALRRETVEQIVRELRRLESDRASLVGGSSGALCETDAVIVRMNDRMRHLQQQLASVRGTAATTAVVAVGGGEGD